MQYAGLAVATSGNEYPGRESLENLPMAGPVVTKRKSDASKRVVAYCFMAGNLLFFY